MNITIASMRAQRHLLDLLKIPGLSGEEMLVAAHIEKCLRAAGCKPAWMRRMPVCSPLPEKFGMGNLVIRLPGTFPAPRRMFLAHMDTVPLCRNAQPVIKQGCMVARGKTALGGDNRAGVAALLTVAETILQNKLPHPPLTFLFTVGEEIGLYGAKSVKAADVGRPAMAFNFDSGKPEEIITGAIGAQRWCAELQGISSHAGMHPERGASAILIASRALVEVAEGGWFGKIRKGRQVGTSLGTMWMLRGVAFVASHAAMIHVLPGGLPRPTAPHLNARRCASATPLARMVAWRFAQRTTICRSISLRTRPWCVSRSGSLLNSA